MVVKKPIRKRSTTRKIPEGDVATSQALVTEGVSDTEIIIVVLLLVFLYPIGVICMWVMMRTWPMWVKVVLSLPILLAICFIVLVIFFVREARLGPIEQRYYIHHRIMQTYPKTTLLPSPDLTLTLS